MFALWIAALALTSGEVSQQLLVKTRAQVGAKERARLFFGVDAKVVSKHFERVYLIRAKDAARAERKLLASGRFEYVERDHLVERVPQLVPNDPIYSQQWHAENVGAEAAWEIAQGDESIIIAVIDSGVQALHPDLATKLVEPYDAITDTPGTAEPGSGVESGHGTACAGIAAAITNNSEGVAGMCPRCRIMPIKLITASGQVPVSADVRAIEHAWKHNAAVIANSWGQRSGTAVSAALEDAIREATTSGRGGKGAVVVFAAGNSFRENGALDLPSLSTVIAVGATAPDDHRESYSNFGPFVPLYAPAATHSTDMLGLNGFAPGSYTTNFGGTSAAAPVVAGIAGVLLAQNPNLTPVQVKAVLLATADKVHASEAQYDASGQSKTYGFGRVNMLKAVTAVRDGQVCEPSATGEACSNGIDDDCNGLVDTLDPPCAPVCNASAECPSDKICDLVHHRCVYKVAPGSQIGAPCTSSQACGAQAFCLTDHPGGYCTLACSETSACPVGSGCLALGDAGGTYCLSLCRFNSDCRDGYACDERGACIKACQDDCSSGKVCQEGRCVDPLPPGEDAAQPESGSAKDVGIQRRGCQSGEAGFEGLALVVALGLFRRFRRR
jgi:hypothetical protein